MADDVRIKYGSSGYERVRKELSDLEKIGATSGHWFQSMQKQLSEAEASASSFSTKFSGGLNQAMSVAGGFVKTIAEIGVALTSVAGVAAGAATTAFVNWGMSVLKTTESFRMLETSLYGATKSWQAVNTASSWAKEYAAEYPAMYKDVMQALQSFAYIPALKPMIQGGDTKQMKEMMDVVQALMTMRPEQGVQGAIYALREALAGNWRSLMFRFDVPIQSIAESAGMTMEQMKENPQAAMKALKAFTTEFVGAETMQLMAQNLSIQVGNLYDKYTQWLDTLGKTGVYQKVVDYLLKANDAFGEFLKSEKVANWTKEINAALESVVDRLAKVFTEGIDWGGIETLDDLFTALKSVMTNLSKFIKEIWEEIKTPFMEGMKKVFLALKEIAMPIIKDVFIPMGMEMGKMLLQGLWTVVAQNPILTALLAGGKGAMMGATLGSIIPGLGTAVGAAVGGGIGVIAGLTPAIIEGGKQLVGGAPTGTVEAAAKGKEGELTYAQKAKWAKEDPESYKSYMEWVKLNKELTETNKGLEAFANDLRGLSGKGGAISSMSESLEARKKREEKEDKWSQFQEQQQFGYFQQWSRMGMAMAQAPEGVTKGPTPWEQYTSGKMTWEQMRAADRVEKFKGEQMTYLQGMITPEMEKERPNYGMMSKAYGQMFDISYKSGDFGKAQEYMNKSLEAMKKDQEAQAKNMLESLGELKGININTGEMADVLKKTLYNKEGGIKGTAYYPAKKESDEIYETAAGSDYYVN